MVVTYIFPAFAASLYAIGSMGLKKSMQAGTSAKRVMAVSSIAMAIWACPLILLGGEWNGLAALAAIGAGAALFVGRIFAVKALEVGDLSVVAPLLGMKTVLVAILSMVFFPFEITTMLLFSALLASGGIALLQRGPSHKKKGTRKAAFYAMGASFLFAITDICVQGSAKALGVGYFVPLLFLTVALMVPLLGKHPKPTGKAVKPLYIGSAIMGFQTSAVVLLIGLVGEATLINVIYSTRALWSVIVDRIAGESHIRDYMIYRLCGALMICGAVILAIITRLL
ncbi:MAG: hypothetical protein AAFY98_03820 [Verrucomicrobiota bacterium]